jgi:hypothetical protein
MSKKTPLPTAPISGKDLRRYLETQDDFALELEAYRHALGFGFKASHAGLYDDAKTNRRRQFDVRASHENGNRRIDLTIECKSLDPAYPLLIQRVPRPGNESFHQTMLSRGSTTSFGTSNEPQHWAGAGLFTMSGTHLYDSQQQVGKSMKRVKVAAENSFSASDSDIYEKYTQALSSMDELVQVAARELRPQRAAPGLSRAFLPIVLVSDGALWVADYSPSAQLISDPRREADETTFYLGWNYELPNPQDPIHPATFTISHLHIMTRRRLPEFLNQIHIGGPIWHQLFGG